MAYLLIALLAIVSLVCIMLGIVLVASSYD